MRRRTHIFLVVSAILILIGVAGLSRSHDQIIYRDNCVIPSKLSLYLYEAKLANFFIRRKLKY